MANSLGEDLTGKVLEIKKDRLLPQYQGDIKLRLVRAEGGFGCQPGTIGRAVFVKWLIDGDEGRMDGFDFERIVPEDEAKRLMVDESLVWEHVRARRDAEGIVTPFPDHLSDDDIDRYLESIEDEEKTDG